MSPEELYCQDFSERAWYMAREQGAEFYEKRLAVYEPCDQCNKSRSIGYIIFNQDNTKTCYFCRQPKTDTERLEIPCGE